MRKDSAVLVDGSRFDFWEKEVKYTKELFVDGSSKKASDKNDGSRELIILAGKILRKKRLVTHYHTVITEDIAGVDAKVNSFMVIT